MSHPDNYTWAATPIDGGPCVLVDIDGVISDAGHRQWYLDGPRRDWSGFFGACAEDPPIDALIHMVNAFDDRLSVVLLTARPHYVHTKTIDWLGRHRLEWDLLVMRDRSDRGTSSPEFKRRVVRELRDDGFEIELALDDDLRNIEMYQAESVRAVYIHSGYYE